MNQLKLSGLAHYFFKYEIILKSIFEITYLKDHSYSYDPVNKNDGVNLLQGDNAETIIINNLIVINNGLQGKWDRVLQGNTD